MSDQLAENSISISEFDELQASEVQLTDKLLVERDDVAHSLNVGNIREVVGVELDELDPSITQGAVNTNPTVSITPKSTDTSNHRKFNIDFAIPKANQIENTTVVEDTTATRKQTVTLVNTDTTKNTTLVINDGVGIDDFSVTQNNNDSGTSNISVELSDGSTKSLNIKNGKGISSITEDSNTANGATRAITVTYSDGTTSALSVKNGEGIDSVTVNQSSSAGATSTMTLTMSNGTTQTLSVKNGKDFHIEKSYASIAAMEADFANMEAYDFVMIDTGSVEDIDTGKLYYKGTSAWEYVGDLSGKQGIKGDTGVGIASLSFSESQASGGINVLTVTLTDGTTQTFNIKNGAKGDTGERGTGVFAGTDFSETGYYQYGAGGSQICDQGLYIWNSTEENSTTYKAGDIYIQTATNNVYKAVIRTVQVSQGTPIVYLYWQLIGNIQGKSVGSITAPSTVDTSNGAGNTYTVKDTDGNAIGTFTVYNANNTNADTATNATNSSALEGKSLETVYKMSNAGGICFAGVDTAAKTVSIPGFTLYTGVRVSVLFSNRNTAANPTLNVNSTGAIEIRASRANNLVALSRKNAKWRNNSSAFYEMWQANTILNLIYNGTYWVVEGNPVLESYYSTTNSYVVYADGKIEQWGTFTYSTTARDFMIPFTKTPTMTCTFNSDSSGTPQYREFPRPISATQWNQIYGNASVSNGTWYAVGY